MFGHYKMKKILLVGSQHGDELLGVHLFEHIKLRYPELLPYVDYVCANPVAFDKKVRFIESDMNRSFGKEGATHEEQEATKLLEYINETTHDYIIDCHTTTTKVGLCFIVPDLGKARRKLISKTNAIKNIVVLPADITDNSLIGKTDNSISIECYKHLGAQEDTLELLADWISNLVIDKKVEPVMRSIFAVKNYIKESLDEPLVNFEEARNGLVPVLVGGDMSKRTYQGFWAKKLDSKVL